MPQYGTYGRLVAMLILNECADRACWLGIAQKKEREISHRGMKTRLVLSSSRFDRCLKNLRYFYKHLLPSVDKRNGIEREATRLAQTQVATAIVATLLLRLGRINSRLSYTISALTTPDTRGRQGTCASMFTSFHRSLDLSLA